MAVAPKMGDCSVRKRAVNPSRLLEAMEAHGLHEGTMLTFGQKDVLKIRGKAITVLPMREWLVGQE